MSDSKPPSSDAIPTQSGRRARLILLFALAGAWIFLALHRELLFHAFRTSYDERSVYLIFANQAGLTHALLFCIAAIATLPTKKRVYSLIPITIGLLVASLTIALARIGYPHNQVDTFQSMAIRALAFFLFLPLARKYLFQDSPANSAHRGFSIADALLMTLVAAIYLAAIRGELNYFRRVTTIDLLYIRDDIASLVLFAFESVIETSIGLLWLGFIKQRRSLAISLPITYAATLGGSALSTLAYKLYRLYQFTEPAQIRTIQDTFQTHLPILLAFTTWLCLLGIVLRFTAFVHKGSRE